MTNQNYKNKTLVTDDDDATAELEILVLSEDQIDGIAEAQSRDPLADTSPTELRSALRVREKTVERLTADIERLREEYLELETEFSSEKSSTLQINKELEASQKVIARNETMLGKRDQKIKALKADIRKRNDEFSRLKNDHIDSLLTVDVAASVDIGNAAIEPASEQATHNLAQRLRRSEEYADTIRQQSNDLIKKNAHVQREIDYLSNKVIATTERNAQISEDLLSVTSEAERLQSTLDTIEGQHDEEIRMLRFELGSAQSTIVETEETSSQLAADLIDSRGVKDQLQIMLTDAKKQTSNQVRKLERKIKKLLEKVESYEQKLTTKSEAISMLLSELAKKSVSDTSVSDIDDFTQDDDHGLTEYDSTIDPVEITLSQEKITRVLVGTVDDQKLRFPLFKNRLTIGRTDDNDIQLEASYVSRRHAVIKTDGDVARIIDWGSKNGILVNSANVSEHSLSHGDSIMIGKAQFRYEERSKRDAR